MKQLRKPEYKRFLSGHSNRYDLLIKAAKEYVSKLDKDRYNFLFTKPYDLSPYNKWFYIHMYEILNLLQIMRIKSFGRVLEVGSGPGFLTEILMALGYVVDAIEPSENFIDIAKERVSTYAKHHHISDPPEIKFYCTTLEECDLDDNTFDAVIFYAALHHIVDEEKALENVFRMLRPGGCLGISEGAWIPGNRDIEEPLEKEMQQYGTLENPFTREYLDYLLQKSGFIQIVRYHQINGLFPVSNGKSTIQEAAQQRAEHSNILTAIKPYVGGKTTEDPDAKTLARIILINKVLNSENNTLDLKVKLYNCGETTWLNSSMLTVGSVNLALFHGEIGKDNFLEAEPRANLPEPVPPGKNIEISVTYHLPENYQNASWFLDLVNEYLFWFSKRGTKPLRVI